MTVCRTAPSIVALLLVQLPAPAQVAPSEPRDLVKLAHPVTRKTRWLWMVPYLWLDSHTVLLFKRVPFDAKDKDAVLGPIVSRLDLRTGKETPLRAFSKRWASMERRVRWAVLSPDKHLVAMETIEALNGPVDRPVVAPLDGAPPVIDHPLLLAIGAGRLSGQYSDPLRPFGSGMWGQRESDIDEVRLTTADSVWAGSTSAPHVRLLTSDGYRVQTWAGWLDGRNRYVMLAALAKEGKVWSWRLARYDVPIEPGKDVVVAAKPPLTPRPGMHPTDVREALVVPGRSEVILCCMTKWHGVGARRWMEFWWANRDLSGFRLIGRIEEPRETAGFDDCPLFLAVRPDGKAISFILRNVLYVCPLPGMLRRPEERTR